MLESRRGERRGGCVGEGEGQGDGRALIGSGAGGGDVASVLADYVANQEETETGALDFDGVASGNAVEAVEDALVLVRRKTEAGVGNAEGGPGVMRDGKRTTYVGSIGGVLDGVVEEVEDGCAEVVGDALNVEPDGAGDGFEDDAVGLQVMTLEGDGDAVGDERGEIDQGAVLLAMLLAELAGLQNLLDGC